MKDVVRSIVAGAAGAALTLAVVVGQPALADQVDKAKAKKITSAMIKNGTIQPKDLNAQVNASLAKAGTALQKIPDGSVGTAQLGNQAVTSGKLANGSVTGTQLATGSVTTPKIGAGAVTGTQLADGSVTGAKIPDGSVAGSKLTAGGVGSTQLGSNAVTGSKVQDGSLTAADIALETGTFQANVPSLATNQCVGMNGIFETNHNHTNDLILVSNPSGVAGAVQLSARPNSSNSLAFDLVACDIGGAFDPPPATFTYVIIGS